VHACVVCARARARARFASSPFSLRPPPPPPHSLVLSLPLPVIPLLFQRCPSDTLAQPTTYPLSLSLSPPLSLSPLVLPRLACRPVSLALARSRSLLPLSRSPFSLPPAAVVSLALANRAPPPAFLSAERRTGFRRKETTIRRIVATDHSWRVDRINRVD